MSTHRLFAAACADWVVVLTDGRVTEQGPPAQLRQAGGWYARQWRHQQLQAAIDEAR
jgi:ABC-type multidrug transport system fused ATPase/permease subunit